jgi:hypothetical protein
MEVRRCKYLALGGFGDVHANKDERDHAHDFSQQALEPARELKDGPLKVSSTTTSA